MLVNLAARMQGSDTRLAAGFNCPTLFECGNYKCPSEHGCPEEFNCNFKFTALRTGEPTRA